jgi:hypothetical protein
MATQMVSREVPADQRRHLLAYLETNQVAFTRAALKELEGRRREILQTFNCERTPKNTAMSLEQILKPLPEYSPLPDAAKVEETPSINAGRSGFRLEISPNELNPLTHTARLTPWHWLTLLGSPKMPLEPTQLLPMSPV